MVKNKNNLDTLLLEISTNFITIKNADKIHAKQVFEAVFGQVKKKMAVNCNYFNQYCGQDLYAGSVFDKVKVAKMDEFDMDIVIKLPINYDDIIIENEHAGFVKLKIGKAFDDLCKQSNWDNCHKVTYGWRDAEKYLLQNKFRQWIQSLVQRALTDLKGMVNVNGITYLVTFNESGPAYTLNICSNNEGHEHFKLNVDLVPVIRFMYPRWPEGYRTVQESLLKEWLVVPKPDNRLIDEDLKNRCWRLSFQHFERDKMKGCQHLKTTLRYVKKLRDSLKMNAIASYYIKTLFLWKIDEVKEKKFWENKLTFLFEIMIEDLYKAIKDKRIKYFWNEEHNLLDKLSYKDQQAYFHKIREYLGCLQSNNVAGIAAGLLTPEEFQELERSECYQRQLASFVNSPQSSLSRSESENTLDNNPDSGIEEEQDEESVGHRSVKKKFFLATIGLLGLFSTQSNDNGRIKVHSGATNSSWCPEKICSSDSLCLSARRRRNSTDDP